MKIILPSRCTSTAARLPARDNFARSCLMLETRWRDHGAHRFVPSVGPAHAQQILLRVIVVFQLALVGMMQRLAEAANQMDVGSGHQSRAVFFLHRHDAFERVFLPFMTLMVVHQAHDFVAMGAEELALHRQKSSRVMVMDAMAGGAYRPVRVCRRFQPLPASLMKYRAALRADGRLQQLAPGFVGIMHLFLENPIVPGNFPVAFSNRC